MNGNKRKFTDEDVQKAADFVNFVSDNAKFEVSQPEMIKYVQLLAWYQNTLVPTINSHVLEIKNVTKANAGEPSVEGKSGKAKK